MAFQALSLLFGNNKRGVIAGLEIDASIQETHEAVNTITRNPIEDGSNISDHITNEPFKITMECIVSETPISLLGSIATGAVTAVGTQAATRHNDAVGGKLIGLAGASIVGMVASDRSPAEVWKHLLDIRDKKNKFSIITGLKEYDNMVFTSITPVRNSSVGHALHFTAVMEQITTVSTSLVDVSQYVIKEGQTANSAATKKDTGKQAQQAAKESTKSTAKTLLDRANSFGA